MMQVLFLDDDHRRIEAFRARYEDICVLTVTETAEECIAALERSEYDVVLLDHDLGGEIYCDSAREDCGMEVVRWLSRRGQAPGVYVLHSYNPGAAQLMLAGLDRLGVTAHVAPFDSPKFHATVGELLGTLLPAEDQSLERPGLGERLRRYFRSLRLGR